MRKRWIWLIAVSIGVLAFATRFYLMLRLGLFSVGAYDDGVYFAAAVSFTHGLLPYKDFLLLHPPGVVLAATPAAWLAPWLGDAHAFVVARVVFMAVGGVNAALIALLLRRYGVGAMLTGGLVYALSFPAIYGERSVLLEPFGTLCLLLSLLALQRARALWAARRAEVVVRGVGFWFVTSGVFAGLSVTFKIWYAPFVLVVLVFAGRGWWRVLLGAAGAGLAVLGPFFVLAPAQMWRDIVLAQLGRPGDVVQHFGSRIGLITGAKVGGVWVIPHVAPPVVTAIILTLGILAGVLALLLRGARIFLVFAVVAGLILLASPTFFQHYAVLTAMPLALMVGAMVGRLTGWADLSTRRVWRLPVALAALGAILVAGILVNGPLLGQKPERTPTRLIAALRTLPGCYGTDMPALLLLADRYSHDLSAGCKIEVDPSGYGYIVPRSANGLGRPDNPAFQQQFLTYFRAGDGFVFGRGSSFGLDAPTQQLVNMNLLLAKQGKYVIRANGR